MTGLSGLQGLLSASILLGVLLLLRTANTKREQRHQQFVMPVIAIGYAVVIAVVFYRFNAWFDRVLAGLFQLIPFLERLYQTQWLYIIENVAVVLVFLALKFAYRPIAHRLFSGERFPGSAVVEQFYDYDVASGRWNVKNRLSQVRLLLQVLYWVSLLVTLVLLWAMSAYPAAPAFTAIAFPGLAVLVLGEIWWALDGLTREEARGQLTGEDDASRRIVNYAAVREVFRETFAGRVLDEGVDLANPYSLDSYAALDELTHSEEYIEQLFGRFFSEAKQAGAQIDENLVHTSIGVLRGRSTLINTPFYADLGMTLALPSYIRLLNGGKCLIVLGRDSGAGEISDWFTAALESITGVPGLWNVGTLTPGRDDDLDVGVLRLADLHNLELLREHDEFFRGVETVLLIEPSRILATGQLGLSVVVSRLGRGTAPVYVAIDRNHDGLVDALSHLLKVNITDVIATGQTLGSSSAMVWDASGPQLAAQIMPGVARYLGVGTEIAAVALKYHVAEVEWVGGDKFPVVDMSWIAGQYYGKINSFAEMTLSQRSLDSALRPRANPLGLERAKHRFLVVEDELSNVYESIRLFASRSTDSGFINLISEDYLLRDYMVLNRELFSVDAKAIPSIVPDYARTRRNTVLRLIVMLSAYAISESVLLRELELVGCVPSEPDENSSEMIEAPVSVLLRELIDTYLGLSGVRIEQTPESAAGYGETAERSFRIPAGTVLDRVLNELGAAYFLVEDEAEGRDFIGGCLHNHVQQTLLPGQFITVAGKYYEVLRFGAEGHGAEVVLRRAAEHITGRPAYRQLRSFSIDRCEPADESAPRRADSQIVAERQLVSLRVQTHGYLELSARSQLADARVVTVPDLAERSYIAKDALKIALPGSTPSVRGTIAVLLNELFVSLFPGGHPFVVALAADPEQHFGELLPEFQTVGDEEAIYIVEDSLVDLGLSVAVERHWQRIFGIVTDYLAWLNEPEPETAGSEPALVMFPGDTAEDLAEREARIAEAAERGGYERPQRLGWWARLKRRVAGWFTRTAPASA
ncbi:hypothetical protein, partial [Leucobacter sp. BZR 635]